MDDKFGLGNKKSDIDLTELDLTDFKEYFDEEDAKKEAEAKAQQELIAAQEAEKAALLQAQKEEAERLKKQEEERLAKEQARQEEQEKENAKEDEESADTVSDEDDFAEDSGNEYEEGFEKFASILDISSVPEQNEAQEETETDSSQFDILTNYVPEQPSAKSRAAGIVCAVLILAFIACSGFAAYTYLRKPKISSEISNGEYVGNAPLYAPYEVLKSGAQTDSSSLAAAYALNSNTVGWLTVKGTAVDYPIVQSDDNYKYLNFSDFYNENAMYGTPFSDFRCMKDQLSKNTVIYGHHMNNGLHFGSLDGYESSVFCKEHPLISYQTLHGDYTFKVYAVFYATTQGQHDGGYVFDYYNPNMNDESFKGYIEMLNQYAIYTTDAELCETDKIITLSTCSHVYDELAVGGVDSRLVVVGRLLREGEKAEGNGIKINENPEYRRPQIWYDSQNKENPYASYRTWTAVS